ncbi:MAG TPA: glycosyltransferase family 2 protein [Candidatus Omnitrophota bacterium]|nr:glycosyltransferase family 2 protein [Candidatus Omnitrophota bacterium]
MRLIDISVIVVNYNYAKLIRRCVRSLLSQDLDRAHYEIVVVDDASTDDSIQALDTFSRAGEIKVIKNKENLGIGASAQIGVANSRGKYFVRVDSDDYVQPAFLYMLYNFLKFNPKYVGVSCDYFITDNEERVISVESFRDNGIACGLMFRTSYLEVINSYNPKKRVFEDRDLNKRIDASKIYHLPIPLYNYVRHGNSTTDKYRLLKKRRD